MADLIQYGVVRKDWRVCIPPQFRDALELYEGATLELTLDGNSIIIKKCDLKHVEGGNGRSTLAKLFDAIAEGNIDRSEFIERFSTDEYARIPFMHEHTIRGLIRPPRLQDE
jgi:bifunctional DNA-binding transcriptional regulator/antitoxin component of YhaV-PrlF toxin-antitoxin module